MLPFSGGLPALPAFLSAESRFIAVTPASFVVTILFYQSCFIVVVGWPKLRHAAEMQVGTVVKPSDRNARIAAAVVTFIIFSIDNKEVLR